MKISQTEADEDDVETVGPTLPDVVHGPDNVYIRCIYKYTEKGWKAQTPK